MRTSVFVCARVCVCLLLKAEHRLSSCISYVLSGSQQAWIKSKEGHPPDTIFLVADNGTVLREHARTLRSYGLTNNCNLQILIA